MLMIVGQHTIVIAQCVWIDQSAVTIAVIRLPIADSQNLAEGVVG